MADPKQSPPESAPELTPEQCKKFALEAIGRYQELAIGLREARAYLNPGKDRKPDRKLAFLYGVGSVIQFLQSISFFAEKEVDEPLVQLLFELQTVVNGLPSEDFTVKPGVRGKGIRIQAFQMYCALLLDRYMAAGLTVEEASTRVARFMKTDVSPRTIEDWRNDLSNVERKGAAGELFRSQRNDIAHIGFTVEAIDAAANRLQQKFAGLNTNAHKHVSRDVRKKTKR